MEKKTLIVNLTEKENEIIQNFAEKNNLYKTDVVRKFIELLGGLDAEHMKIIAFDKSDVKLMSTTLEILSCKNNIGVEKAEISLNYDECGGIKYNSLLTIKDMFRHF